MPSGVHPLRSLCGAAFEYMQGKRLLSEELQLQEAAECVKGGTTAGGCRIFVFRRDYFEGVPNARDCRIMEERRAALGELSLCGAA